MNARTLFWAPALLRLFCLFMIAAIVWAWLGIIPGLVTGFVLMSVTVLIQLRYLFRLNNWLDHPHSEKLPSGWGAWSEVFSRLYRLRRTDETHQTELREWLARFRQAMSLLPDGVVIMDDGLFLEWCNPAAEQHLGLQQTRDKGMRITNLIRNPAFMDYIILGRYEQPLILNIHERKLILHIIPFENRRQILVTHDATESERIDMMRRDFIANVSHELRTPLTVINGFLEIAQAQPELNLETRNSHLRLMIEQGKRMQHLIGDMLTLTRLESTDYPLRLEEVHIDTMLDALLQEAEFLSAQQHTFSLKVNGPAIHGNHEELRSAFSNLISNAVRYTPAGGHIQIIWQQGETGPQLLVRDSGIGIHAEHISRLTERFYRVDKGRSRQTQGTGLGLAIVKHVLLRHHASLVIESRLGEGSTFIVNVPADAVI